jgi:hypothetical protein
MSAECQKEPFSQSLANLPMADIFPLMAANPPGPEGGFAHAVVRRGHQEKAMQGRDDSFFELPCARRESHTIRRKRSLDQGWGRAALLRLCWNHELKRHPRPIIRTSPQPAAVCFDY